MHTLILEAKDFSPKALAQLKQLGSVHCFDEEHDQLAVEIAQADIIFTRLKYQINGELLVNARNLKVLVSPTTGVDHLDLVYLERKKVAVLTLRGEREFLNSIKATAEFTWGLILSLQRNIISSHQALLNHRADREAFKGFELKNKTIGIIGLGRVGSQVAEFAHCFGMNILAYEKAPKRMPFHVHFCESLSTLLKHSDLITLHLPLNDSTVNFISADHLACVKPNAFLINTARGEILDNGKLLEMLKHNRLAGAALDVLPEERNPNNPLRSSLIQYAQEHNNLILTPHLGGASYESMENTELFMTEKLLNHLQQLSHNQPNALAEHI